jgi:ABC-2 type transport system permease protein
MKRAKQIYLTFLRIFFRDKGNIIFIFFFNAFLMIIFGLTLEDKFDLKVDIGLVNLQKSAETKKLIEHFNEKTDVIIKEFSSEQSMVRELKNGKLVAGIVLDSLSINSNKSSKKLNINIFGDPSRKMWLKFIEPGLKVALIQSNNMLATELNKISVETEYVKSKNLKYFDFIFPGLLIFSIMQIGLSGGLTLLSQRQNESLKRLKITPLKKWEFLLGYGGSYLSIMVLQNLLYIILAIMIFDYSFSGSWLSLISVIALSSLIFISIGILISNLVSTIENGNNIISFTTFPSAFLCGIFMPIDSMPQIVQMIAKFHPLTHLAAMMRGIANYNNPIEDYRIEFYSLLILLILIAFISIKSFKWQEKLA